MKVTQATTDKISILLSTVCAIHCFLWPLLVVSLPTIAALQLDNEVVHFWIVLTVIPSSYWALSSGVKLHGNYRFLVIGVSGLVLLLLALVLGADLIGELAEQVITIVGSALVVFAHWSNYRKYQTLNLNSHHD